MTFFATTFESSTELDLCWVQDDDEIMMVVQDEDLSESSHSEATQVFEQWQTEDDDEEMNIMVADEQIGDELLNDVIFYSTSSCASPVGPIQELFLVGLNDVTENIFIASADDDSWSFTSSSSSSEIGEQYKASLRKLSESMKRSRVTRSSLTMKTPNTAKYERSTSVSGVINCTEESSSQLQAYLVSIKC